MLEELKAFVRSAVGEVVDSRLSDVRSDLQAARDEMVKERGVISHYDAPVFFGGRISPARIKQYIKGRNLPQGVSLPLPANKIGGSYFIEREALEKWQAGRCTEDDLREWQRH